jgi:hypothetical protein
MKSTMQNDTLATNSYVVEIDGKIKSEYGIFFEALRAGMELKQKFPHSQIRVHEAEPYRK